MGDNSALWVLPVGMRRDDSAFKFPVVLGKILGSASGRLKNSIKNLLRGKFYLKSFVDLSSSTRYIPLNFPWQRISHLNKRVGLKI